VDEGKAKIKREKAKLQGKYQEGLAGGRINPAEALRRKEEKKGLNSVEGTRGICYKDSMIIVEKRRTICQTNLDAA